jgi:hypothetical protein
MSADAGGARITAEYPCSINPNALPIVLRFYIAFAAAREDPGVRSGCQTVVLLRFATAVASCITTLGNNVPDLLRWYPIAIGARGQRNDPDLLHGLLSL